MFKRLCSLTLCLSPVLMPVVGCKASLKEITGKTSFGPEFRNFGNNTHDVRYTAIQGIDLKWSNNWTTGVSYQRRDVDEGSGDNENLVLFEVGYPIWNAPKKPEKTAEQTQIEDLENELRQLDSELAAAQTGNGSVRLAQVEDIKDPKTEKENGHAQP
jgi:hypothetical protein